MTPTQPMYSSSRPHARHLICRRVSEEDGLRGVVEKGPPQDKEVRSTRFWNLVLLSCLPLLMVLTGCGAGSRVTGDVALPTITLAANPNSVSSGTPSVLTVAAANATQVIVSGSDGSSFSMQPTGGTQTLSPTATTTYTGVATGPGGKATGTVTVTVSPTGAPANQPTASITATPTPIALGASSTLSVVAANATQVVVTGTDGSSYTLQATGGNQVVTPTASTTYTATATGTGGSASASTLVTVVPTTPTVRISASPASIPAAGSSVLTVTAANATQVTISGTDGSSYTLQPTGGTQTVSPAKTTTYTALATGPGGTSSSSILVTVGTATPTVNITANPMSVSPGTPSTLTVTATNAVSVIVSGTDGNTYTFGPSGGTQVVTPAKTTTYNAVATGATAGVAGSGSITITVVPTAPTLKITASPTSVPAGTASTIVVLASNATQVTLTGSDGTTNYPFITASGGTASVTPSTTTTYTAVATGTGTGNTVSQSVIVTVVPATAPTVSIVANPTAITSGNSSSLTVTATNATQVTISGSDGSSYPLQPAGGIQSVSPTTTTTYTVTATGTSGTTTSSAVVTVTPPGGLQSVGHVVFMLQENHSFDNYFGMLNPYRRSKGFNVGDDGLVYDVDGIDDKLTTIKNPNDAGTMVYQPFKFSSTCIDDLTSSWIESYGDVNRYNFGDKRPILMDGFIHTASAYAMGCQASNGSACSGTFSDLSGQRAMGYYDQDFLNYYYYMASQFAVSDRWFSPLSTKSIPNRIATFTGGTTQGLVFDPGNNDHLPQLEIPNIFAELDQSKVSWKIYYTVTQGSCLNADDCSGGASSQYPAINFTYLTYSYRYLYENPTLAACVAPTQSSTVVGDASGSFCIDPTHIAPISTYYTDLTNGLLPSFAFIEAGYGHSDEHPGSGQSILFGQQQVATVVNAFMASPMWKDSVFFLSYDEGGGPYDHVPPVGGHSNDNTAATVGSTPVAGIPDISSIAVNADGYIPCVPTGGVPTLHCDLASNDPGAVLTDAPAIHGFSAQLGFRVPNMVISPFTRRHYVSHIPMDHTAVMKFVETRFVTNSTNLTPHEAAQPSLLDFFDFSNTPWATPPMTPTPASTGTLGYDSCTPTKFTP